MAISTYSELQAAIARFAVRTDLGDQIIDCISLVEGDLNSHFNLRTLETDQSLVAVPGSRFVALPATFREQKNLWIEWPYGRSDPLRFVTPDLLTTSAVAGIPQTWCIDGLNIAFEKPAASSYALTLRMIAGLELSDANPTNLVLTNYPNVYLYGALVHVAAILANSIQGAMWAAAYQDALAKAKAKESRSKASTTLVTEIGLMGRHSGRSGFNINRG